MRVAILTRDYPPAIGGIATHVEGLMGALQRLGVEADLYVGSNDVKTLLLPFDMPLKSYDVVHAQSLPYGAFVIGAPLVVTVHSPVLEEFAHYRNSLKMVSVPAVALEKVSLSRAKAVLAVSAQSRSDLLTRYGLDPGRVQVIGNGVDYEKFSGVRDYTDPLARKRILVVSRLEPRKNVREAVQAVAELAAGSCVLDIAGDGSERAGLEQLAKSAGGVRFLGRVGEASLPELYGKSSIFLTTSSSEGFGLSLLEAMSCVVRGTLVSTSNGLVPIENIEGGTLVLSHTGRFRPVLRTYRGIRGGTMYLIETSHGRICVSPTHKILTRNGWISADSLYSSYKLDRLGRGIHRRLFGRGEPHDNTDSKTEQERQASRERIGSSAIDRGRSELQAPGSSILVAGKTWRTRLAGSKSARVEVDDWGQTRRWSNTATVTPLADLQERGRNGGLGGVQQEALFCEELTRGVDLVYRQGNSGAFHKFTIQPGTLSEDARPPEWLEIRSVEPIQYIGEIFDLSVMADNSYVANGVIVHNSGCACLASDLPTHRALIEHRVSGLIYANRQELVSFLKELLSSPEEVERLGEAARRVAAGHTWDKVAERVAQAYRMVAQ